MNKVRRRYGFALAAALAVAAIGPVIAGAIMVGEWTGHVKGDPDSFITFDVRKNDAGVKRVRDVAASGLNFTCEKGSPGEADGVQLEGRFRVRHGEFGGETSATISGFDPRAVISGKFKPGKRAVGTLRVKGRLDPIGQPGVRCDTGHQPWRASKQGAP